MKDRKYTTLVFENKDLDKIRSMSIDKDCKAWSIDHELHRLSLIEDAYENNDIERIGEYLSMTGPNLIAEIKKVFN